MPMDELTDEFREQGDVDEGEMLPRKAAPEERRAGFVEGVIRRPREPAMFQAPFVHAVFCDLGGGRRAVKTGEGSLVTYAIWDAKQQRPVDGAAVSIDELRGRYPTAFAWEATHKVNDKRCKCGRGLIFRLAKDDAALANRPFWESTVACPDARCGRVWKPKLVKTKDGFNVEADEVSPSA